MLTSVFKQKTEKFCWREKRQYGGTERGYRAVLDILINDCARQQFYHKCFLQALYSLNSEVHQNIFYSPSSGRHKVIRKKPPEDRRNHIYASVSHNRRDIFLSKIHDQLATRFLGFIAVASAVAVAVAVGDDVDGDDVDEGAFFIYELLRLVVFLTIFKTQH
uniref:Uncharacterized protein n=1 Tax=Glossina pallidipes TaxID=7398 RepID=A0A1A9ZXU1_GLOPL